MFKIEEHNNRALASIKGVGQKSEVRRNKLIDERVNTTVNPKEYEGTISQILPMYLDSKIASYVENIDPFFLSVVVNRKTLKNYMIDSGASNIVMRFKSM